MFGAPEMGDFFDDAQKFVRKASGVVEKAQQVRSIVRDVSSGKKRVAVVPSKGISFVAPVGTMFGFGIPVAYLAIGAVGLALLLSRRRGR